MSETKEVSQQEYAVTWFCTICELEQKVCKCRAVHKLTGWLLISFAVVLFISLLSLLFREMNPVRYLPSDPEVTQKLELLLQEDKL